MKFGLFKDFSSNINKLTKKSFKYFIILKKILKSEGRESNPQKAGLQPTAVTIVPPPLKRYKNEFKTIYKDFYILN